MPRQTRNIATIRDFLVNDGYSSENEEANFENTDANTGNAKLRSNHLNDISFSSSLFQNNSVIWIKDQSKVEVITKQIVKRVLVIS